MRDREREREREREKSTNFLQNLFQFYKIVIKNTSFDIFLMHIIYILMINILT